MLTKKGSKAARAARLADRLDRLAVELSDISREDAAGLLSDYDRGALAGLESLVIDHSGILDLRLNLREIAAG
jgi:hypothetical protein